MQVLLFAVLAIELKKKAPSAHTFLEVVLARYGKGAHIVYLTFSMITNIVSVTMQFSKIRLAYPMPTIIM